ncbi:hypothetical protein STEG23_015504, partial [Scotinomys teguina]
MTSLVPAVTLYDQPGPGCDKIQGMLDLGTIMLIDPGGSYLIQSKHETVFQYHDISSGSLVEHRPDTVPACMGPGFCHTSDTKLLTLSGAGSFHGSFVTLSPTPATT